MTRPRRLLGLTLHEWTVCTTPFVLERLVRWRCPARWQGPARVAVAIATSRLAAAGGVGPEEQGLGPRHVRGGLLYGLAAAVPIAGAMAAGLCFERSRPFYRDPRVIAATPAQAAWETFIRIPLATALPEEAIFRGAILGTLSRRRSRLLATAITSGLFGLWHVAPSLERLETGPGLHGGGRADRAGWVALSVLVTALAGFPLAALRYRSRSIVAPWLGHCAANGAGFAGAWLVARLAQSNGAEAGLTRSK